MHYLAVWSGAFVAVALSAIVWSLASAGGPVASFSPGLGPVLAKMTDPALAAHAAASFRTLATGFAAAAVAGIVLGLAIGLAEGSRRFLGPFVAALAALPMVMAAPLIVLYAGVGVRHDRHRSFPRRSLPHRGCHDLGPRPAATTGDQ